MSTTDTERYVRLSLLTYKGGKWIGTEILQREVANSGCNTLDEKLQKHKTLLQHKRNTKELSGKHFKVIFPQGGCNTCLEDWDVQLIIKVILYLFGASIPRQENGSLSDILTIRNELISHAGQPSIDENKFMSSWSKLSGCLYSLAANLGPGLIMQASELINSLIAGPLDLKSSIDKLAELCRHDEHMETVLESLWRIERGQDFIARGVTSANKKLDDLLAAVQKLSENQDSSSACKKEIPMLKNKILISGQTEEPVQLAEDILQVFMKKALQRADDPTDDKNIREAVEQYLEEFRRDGSDVVTTTDGSVIVHISCRSLAGLCTLLKRFAVNMNRIRLVRIENALNAKFKEEFQVYTVIPDETIDCLWEWIERCLNQTQSGEEGELLYQRELILGIQCQTAEAVARVTDYFQNGQAANSLNSISEALSSRVQDKIRVDATLNIEEFSDAVEARYKETHQDEETVQKDVTGTAASKTREPMMGHVTVTPASKPEEPTLTNFTVTPASSSGELTIENVTVTPASNSGELTMGNVIVTPATQSGESTMGNVTVTPATQSGESTMGNVTVTPATQSGESTMGNVTVTPATQSGESTMGNVTVTPATKSGESTMENVTVTPATQSGKSTMGNVTFTPATQSGESMMGNVTVTPATQSGESTMGNVTVTPASQSGESTMGNVTVTPATQSGESTMENVTVTPATQSGESTMGNVTVTPATQSGEFTMEDVKFTPATQSGESTMENVTVTPATQSGESTMGNVTVTPATQSGESTMGNVTVTPATQSEESTMGNVTVTPATQSGKSTMGYVTVTPATQSGESTMGNVTVTPATQTGESTIGNVTDTPATQFGETIMGDVTVTSATKKDVINELQEGLVKKELLPEHNVPSLSPDLSTTNAAQSIEQIYISQETPDVVDLTQETAESDDVESKDPDSLNMDEYVVVDDWHESNTRAANGQTKRKKIKKGSTKRQKMNDETPQSGESTMGNVTYIPATQSGESTMEDVTVTFATKKDVINELQEGLVKKELLPEHNVPSLSPDLSTTNVAQSIEQVYISQETPDVVDLTQETAGDWHESDTRVGNGQTKRKKIQKGSTKRQKTNDETQGDKSFVVLANDGGGMTTDIPTQSVLTDKQENPKDLQDIENLNLYEESSISLDRDEKNMKQTFDPSEMKQNMKTSMDDKDNGENQYQEMEADETFFDAPTSFEEAEPPISELKAESLQTKAATEHVKVTGFVFGTGRPSATATVQSTCVDTGTLQQPGPDQPGPEHPGPSRGLTSDKPDLLGDVNNQLKASMPQAKTQNVTAAHDIENDNTDSESSQSPESDSEMEDQKPKTILHNKNAKKREKQEQTLEIGSTNTYQPPRTRSALQFYEKRIKVHFHVFVDEAFKFSTKARRLVLRSDMFKGWQINGPELQLKRKWVDEKVYEMERVVDLPLHQVYGERGRFYKYFIIKKAEKGEYEKYWVDKKLMHSNRNENRSLVVPYKFKDKEVWHQYDGYIERSPKSKFGKVKHFFGLNDISKHMKMSTSAFAMHIFEDIQDGYGVEEAMDKFSMLFTCARKNYYVDAKRWNFDKDFTQEFGTIVLKTHLDKLGSDKKEMELVKSILCTLLLTTNLSNMDLSENIVRMLCSSLILPPDRERTALKITEEYFCWKSSREIKQAFVSLVRNGSRLSKDPCWLYVMPWIHFLSESCVPNEVPEVDLSHDYRVPRWWGISHIGEDTVKQFKEKFADWSIPLQSVVHHLYPLFEMDYLLPRTIMSVIELNNLRKAIETGLFPTEVSLAALNYYVKIYSPKNVLAKISADEGKLLACADALLRQLEITKSSGKYKSQMEMSYRISAGILDFISYTNHGDLVATIAKIAANCIAIYDAYIDHNKESQKGQEHFHVLRKCADTMTNWFRTCFIHWSSYLPSFLQMWNKTLVYNIPSETVCTMWNKAILSSLPNTLEAQVCRTSGITEHFVKLFCEIGDTFHPKMQDILSKTAFEAISVGHYVDNEGFTEQANEKYGVLLSNMFNSEWEKAVREENNKDPDQILRHVLRYRPFLRFLKIYNQEQQKLMLLNEECWTRIALAISDIDSKLEALLIGTLNVSTLSLISAPNSIFCELAVEASSRKMKDPNSLKDLIMKAIAVRQKEIEFFKEQAAHLTSLTALCQCIGNVDIDAIDEILRKQGDMEHHRLNEFINPADVNTVENIETFRPIGCMIPLPPAVIAILADMTRCYESSTFLTFWEHKCREQAGRMTVEDVLQRVWKPVKESWDKKAEEIASGTVTFQSMEKVIGHLYQDDYGKMREELRRLGLQEDVINLRIDQLREYRQLETCVKGARIILNFSKEYQLAGNFSDIENIARYGQSVIQMKSFDRSLIKTCEFLKHLGDEKAECLETFVHCGPLISWLKESMKSGLKELKVFVDLAMMSAGEEPMNIKRVQCLHSAVTGYGPLIFDLKQAADYKMLLSRCELVWKELAANPKLPIQLKDTNRHIEWLKDVKKAHGSVEVTSMFQADAINSSGIYTVGVGAWKVVTDSNAQDISSVLKLTVPEEEGKRQRRNYNIAQLQDLQSRLMLVAGKADKGSEGVEIFTSVFDSIMRLSNVYKKLCASGCVLYKEWTARFFCLNKRDLCTILEFGQSEDVPKLKGLRNENEDLREFVPKIANFMESCYEDWLNYIKEKRREYLHLNYFTVDQLVILQKELVKCGTDEEPSHYVYPLLSAVKQDCTPEDLLAAMAEAKDILDTAEEMETEEVAEMEDISQDQLDQIQRQKFVQEIVDAGYSQELATKALDHISADDIDEGIVWCMDHCDDEDEDMDSHDDMMMHGPGTSTLSSTATSSTSLGFTGWNLETHSSMQSIIAKNIKIICGTQRGTGVKPLLEELQLLWKEFLGSISSNVKDYLSLEHLGLILRRLSNRDASSIERLFPHGYQEGKPNLLVCPSGDVLPMVLTLYMMTQNQPLPQSDEVLLCTANTTLDEVDIFWRRALYGNVRKIYCLVNADMLDYEVSDKAEKCLEEYLQSGTADQPYRLVVICGSENEYRSRIVSSLDKHSRTPLPIIPEQIKNYLATKLQVGEQFGFISPAAFVDFNRSSVRLVKSWRPGVGKTLYKERREEELAKLNPDFDADNVTIPLQKKSIDQHRVLKTLLEHSSPPGKPHPRIFHIDVAHEVQHGVDYLLFNLLVLGCVMDKTGYVWRKSPADLYLIETMPLMFLSGSHKSKDVEYAHKMLSLLPDMTCCSPQESLNVYTQSARQPKDYSPHDQLFDEVQFSSPIFQRPFQYLYRHDQAKSLADIDPFNPEGDPQTCLQTLLRHCGVKDPSWAELHHFVWFLNTQLQDSEKSDYMCAAAGEEEYLPGFSKFVLRFMIQMSRDFSTRSLNMSEESPGLQYGGETMDVDEDDLEEEDDILHQLQMRRTWESSPHPYLFFNYGGHTFTFLGFQIDRRTGDLVDLQTRTILERQIMSTPLFDSLVLNKAPLQENFEKLKRHERIQKMCNVMGIEFPHDPDDTYELTTDNVKKIMAIFMRFRCDIPVIIMGETGCGKTRLIKFMCSLQMPPGLEVSNMVLMKVHGGTTNADIQRKVEEAEKFAIENVEKYGKQMYTVLFFDEANTTESIGLIKEIMCDKSLEGRKLKLSENLKIVAACNPYRKHSDELIKKLEQAGLGYHVDAEETSDKLGRVPMRRLVYRVQPLPQSLLPLVWDFGQLNTNVEDLYIRQMVRRYIREGKLPKITGLVEVMSSILTASQDFMRQQNDECSFVSLRDVDRVLGVMSWFHEQSQEQRTLFKAMDKLWLEIEEDDDNVDSNGDEDDDEFEDAEEDTDKPYEPLEDATRSLVLALGVCYHACLRDRKLYREHIQQYFKQPCLLPGGADRMEKEILFCQDVFLDNVILQKNIAKNMALKENVFMMVVCIELRIPLFLVGKPGSSKSLAKTIVSDAMHGNASHKKLFQELKQAQMVSFQCSPLSTPESIVGTFRQCAQFQKDKDLDGFVSIVVLDEVGLAEDSPRMPLKTLHPLLEDGCQGDETPEQYKKVAFIGISNWALDPAKMNRGILVQRMVPDLLELKNSARGICWTRKGKVLSRIEHLIEPMAVAYLQLFEEASKQMREFYGLRDFYSIVKMVFAFAERSKQKPTWCEMVHAIKRNFGGLDQIDPVASFKANLSKVMPVSDKPKPTDPDCSPAGLIHACLFDTSKTKSVSRYLLLLTENYSALSILEQEILTSQSDIRPITIFGSSFRRDQEYTQVCRNINKIKVCMETGNTVVLLNLENLYESLYDALNQYYEYFGGERYVDLGLGTHRVKCPVHKNFRLIVVAEKQIVYKKFPIPLINRLEKHFLTLSNMLSPEQHDLVKKLEEWAQNFVKQNLFVPLYKRSEKVPVTKVNDGFMGYHDDTCAAIVIHVWKMFAALQNEYKPEDVFQATKEMLLWCATPDAVVRLDKSSIPADEAQQLKEIYFDKQTHDNIAQYLHEKLLVEQRGQLLAQVTTHSKLLATFHRYELSRATELPLEQITLLDTLSSFDTEQQFSNKIKQHFKDCGHHASLLLVQCDSGDVNASLVACARYSVMDEIERMREDIRAPVHVVFIVQLPNLAAGCFSGFQCGAWHSVHIDELWSTEWEMPTVIEMQGKSVATLFHLAVLPSTDTDTPTPAESISWGEASMELDEPVASTSSAYTDTLKKSSDFMLSGADRRYSPELKDDMSLSRVGQDKAPGKQLNVRGLVLSCVQSAMAMVKDKEENAARTTERVRMVLQLFHQQTGDKSFLHGVCSLIGRILKDKEMKEHGGYLSNQWLVNEAAKSENIQKAGTFRKACLQTLEAKISPILAGIIAYLDTNQNLDLLQDGPSRSTDTLQGRVLAWKQTFALAVVNTKDAIPLKYSDLQSPKRQSNLTEVIVMTTGCEGQMFVAKMPFSWLIHKQLYDVLKVPVPSTDEEGTRELSLIDEIQYYIGVTRKSVYGKLLDIPLDLETEQVLIDDYISDFVYILYKVGTPEEHLLVCESIKNQTNQMLEKLPQVELLHRLVCVHLAYKHLAPRLGYFHAMNCVWSECSKAIVHVKQTNPDHYMFKEKDFTYGALGLLIENLDPGKDSLNVPENQPKWLQKVHQYRHVIEKVLSCEDDVSNESVAQGQITKQRARCLWNRVVVVKLFLEHVCVAGEKEKIAMKHCMSLWKVLREETDMKKLHSMEALEKFLKSCNRLARKEFLGKEDKCCQCDSTLDGPPVMLPCGHILCDACMCDLRALDDNICPKCKKHFAKDWTPEKQTKDSEAVKKMKEYQKRCNSFFMDVVSQLCFADNFPPETEVVEKLVKYVLCKRPNAAGRQGARVTKEMSIFETGIDPNPVFRSFLLQLLMRTSQEEASSNLEVYLQEAVAYISSDDVDREQQYIQLCLLVLQCFEDMLLQETISSKHGPLAVGTSYLRHAVDFIDKKILNVEKLRALAETRVGLGICASHIATIIKKKQNISQQDPKVRRLIEAAQIICEEGESKWPRIYLIKYLCRSFGVDVYKALCKSEKLYLRWITMTNLVDNKRIEGPDRYVSCGDLYVHIREALTKVILGESAQKLIESLQEMIVAGGHVEVMLRLAIHREITCSYLYPEAERNVNQMVINTMEESVMQSDVVKNKELFQALLHNNLGLDHLTIKEGDDHGKQGLQCLIQHFISVLTDLKGERTLMQPFLTLLQHPEQTKDFYLPTMPQDDLDELREALLAARQQDGDYNPLFYRCPNGHPYVIGNCGRPVDKGQCKDCGADIGGEGYNRLIAGNSVDQGVDQTPKGHVLGRAEGRGRGPKPERNLRPVSCACLRLLTHMSMYLGTVSNKQAIQSIITPDLELEDVPEFLWQHILFDLEDLQRGLGRSMDDILLVIHAMINDIMIKHDPADIGLRDDHIQLSSKLGRKEWEDKFSIAYVQPVLQNVDDLLTKFNNIITQDNRLGGDPLLCLLYETGSHQDTIQLGMLHDLPDVWRYRTPITIDHLTHELETQVAGGPQQQNYPVLQLFLKEDHYLRALRHVPNILRLQRHLFNKYQRRLDKAEATTITIGRLKQDDSGVADIGELIDSFCEAWEVVREVLPMWMCPTDMGGMVVPKEYCIHPVTDNTPIAILLPSTKEMGLCSYALLDFLFRKQNDFLDKYITASKRSLGSVSTVCPMDITSAHLISYEPQQDLLPMVLANCKYSFEMGKGTKVEYDFEGLEKQLMDRFLFSKSRINIQGTLQIEQMVFRAEITDATVFKNLAEKIPQEGLSAAVKSQIGSELKTLPDICSSMDNLDITISFLTSVSGDPEQNLNDFMVNTLKMENSLKSQKAKQECRFKHTQSLWLLLALLKSKQIADHQQPRESLFETVEMDFNEDLPDAVRDELVEYLKQQSIDTVSHLVELIHEYIVLVVAVRENPDEEDYTDKRDNRLKDFLYAYVEAMERPSVDPMVLANLPADILFRHSSHMWAETYKMLQVKLSGHRLY